MELINKKENQITFKCKINESLANVIRRYINEIPILAIDEVEIFKNDSPLYDETIAHRIGLIPLKMDKSMDEKTIVPIKLVSKKEGVVLSGETSGKIKPVYENIPITSLNQEQELEITGIARSGKGSKHAKFSPGLMFYRKIQEIILDKDLVNEVKKIYPALEGEEKGDKIIIIDDKKTEVADICESISEKKGKKIEIKEKEGLVITLESFGQISTEEMFKKAIEETKKDLSDISKKVSKA